MKTIMYRLWFGFLLFGLIGGLSVTGFAQNDRSTSRRSKTVSQEKKERKTERSRQQNTAPKRVTPEKRTQERRTVQRTPERKRDEQQKADQNKARRNEVQSNRNRQTSPQVDRKQAKRNDPEPKRQTSQQVDRNQVRRNDPEPNRQTPPQVDRDQVRRNDPDRNRPNPSPVDRNRVRRNDPEPNRPNPPRVDRDQARRDEPADRFRSPRPDRSRDHDRRFRDRDRGHNDSHRGWGYDKRYKPDRNWHHPYWIKHHRPRKRFYLEFGWSPFFYLDLRPSVRFSIYTRPLIHDRTYIVFTKEYDSYDYMPGDVIGYSVHITFTGYARVYNHYYDRSPLLVRQFQVDAQEMRRLREILETGRYYDNGTCLYDTYGEDDHPAYATIAYRHRPHDPMRSVSLNLVAPDYLYPAYFVDFMGEIDWLLDDCGYF